jgi:hypothetical protein
LNASTREARLVADRSDRLYDVAMATITREECAELRAHSAALRAKAEELQVMTRRLRQQCYDLLGRRGDLRRDRRRDGT